MSALPVPAARPRPVLLTRLDQLAAIPEEEIWLAKQKSAQTRRAYRLDVRHFMRALGITSTAALRQVDHRAVIAWERMQREREGAAPSTVRRRLAAFSSLFKHLVKHGAASRNPVVDVERPAISRDEGSTAAFSKIRARKLLGPPAAPVRQITAAVTTYLQGLERRVSVGSIHERADRQTRHGSPLSQPILRLQITSTIESASTNRCSSFLNDANTRSNPLP